MSTTEPDGGAVPHDERPEIKEVTLLRPQLGDVIVAEVDRADVGEGASILRALQSWFPTNRVGVLVGSTLKVVRPEEAAEYDSGVEEHDEIPMGPDFHDHRHEHRVGTQMPYWHEHAHPTAGHHD